MTKPVYFTRHARTKMAERMATEGEVVETIRQATWRPAEKGRKWARRWYPFGKEHRGTFYKGKDVQPVFVDEPGRVVVVTVYVYLNQREG